MSGARARIEKAGARIEKGRLLLLMVLVAASLFFGSILFILSRAPRP